MTTLVACSHGTRDAAGQAAIARLVDAVTRALPGLAVAPTYVDVQQPQVAEVVGETGGPTVVVPLLLSSGYHVHVDIASAVAGRDEVVAAPALGPDPVLAGLLVKRLRQVGLRSTDKVVLAAAGSSDPQARRDTERAAALLATALGRPVALGHVGGPQRHVAEVVEQLGRDRTSGRTVVSPYLLAPGWFRDRLDGVGADLVSAPLLDGGEPDARLTGLVVRRFLDARGRAYAQAA
ncbi:sirohydrochlorin chelatase [Mumia zhuanghuii]|uniref:Sirohydrochlorin chelatase n=2 Tax=Mumia TaxID=1546255 RepID=A0ABW1QQ94_9ACTN|nr:MULTISPECIES: CbiX/SirB N-terminal domain-containing protein [Mumia]KAA1420616.1 sirohydrochlorin chelatase [Mumia zhuanghuii]